MLQLILLEGSYDIFADVNIAYCGKGVVIVMNYFVHESSYIDENVEIGDNTKIWHFCHIQSGAKIGGGVPWVKMST